MYKIFILFILTIYSNIVTTQNDVSSGILVSKTDQGILYFDYYLEKGQTLYSFSKKIKIPLDAITAINPNLVFSEIDQDESIKIPFRHHLNHSKPNGQTITPFIYTVQAKETLYTISKIYFDKNVSEIKKMNNLESGALAIGQQIIVGFTSNEFLSISNHNITYNSHADINKGDQELNDEVELSNEEDLNNLETEEIFSISNLINMIDNKEADSTALSITPIDTVFIEKELINYDVQKGLAYIQEVEMEGVDFFVLHSGAKIGSEMEITYPMLNRTIKAKVISELPKESYPKNIDVVISPNIAKALGARDNLFRVEMKYIAD